MQKTRIALSLEETLEKVNAAGDSTCQTHSGQSEGEWKQSVALVVPVIQNHHKQLMAESEISDFYVDEDLEDVFHRQLKTLDLENNATSRSDIVGDHLPEWLIGVIIVVIMLIIAFFAMVVTSISKKRNNVKGDNSANPYEDLESGAVTSLDSGETLQVASFVYKNDTTPRENNAESASPPPATPSASGKTGNAELKGCQNPLFVEDEEEPSHSVAPNNPTETQKTSDPDLIHNELGSGCGEASSCSNNSITSETDPTEGAGSHGHGGSDGPAKPAGLPYNHKRFSRLNDTRREIMTEAVVENSFELDKESKHRRKYLAKANNSTQIKDKNHVEPKEKKDNLSGGETHKHEAQNGTGVITQTTGEESDGSANSSESTMTMNVPCGLVGSGQYQHHPVTEPSGEMPEHELCPEQTCPADNRDSHTDNDHVMCKADIRSAACISAAASTVNGCLHQMREKDASLDPTHGFSSLAKTDPEVDEKSVGTNSLGEQHYSTNL
ncbi:hypothetical protein EGW08_003678 [Elysia chlorotica]|uniref:Uncharacterized protein n=1 Tax=Elysia chlorotica TaxID=188477 RepID=A0A433U459_ELYCH|nr:hypothetical protein EGW08_003678 [Elysia chlorotica]